MSGLELGGIILFLVCALLGLVSGSGLLFWAMAGFGLMLGLILYIPGYTNRVNANRTNALISENPTIIVKDVFLGHTVTSVVADVPSVKWIQGADSSNYWSCHIRAISGYDRPIKYVIFHVSMYNSVGDLQYCDYKKKCHYNLRVVGPISKGEHLDCSFDNIIHAKVLVTPVLTAITVDFADGSSKEIKKEDIKWESSLPWS